MDELVLGVSCPGDHDSNVAIVSLAGDIEFCVNEERLSRLKKDGRFPRLSIALYKSLSPERIHATAFMLLPIAERNRRFQEAGQPTHLPDEYRRRLALHKQVKHGKSYFASHHEAHAASAYYTSGFDDCHVVTMDCGNYCEPWNTTIYRGTDGVLTPITKDVICMPKLYFFVTALLDFRPGKDEGKVTGLAAHGTLNEPLLEFFEQELSNSENIAYQIAQWCNIFNGDSIPHLKLDADLLATYRKRFDGICREDIAHTVQRFTEDKVTEYISRFIPNPSNTDIALAGGLFANVRLNQKIQEMGFRNIFVHPAMGDDGLSLGACLWYLGQEYGLRPFRLKNVFLGPAYSNDAISQSLEQHGLKYERVTNINSQVASILASGGIVARFTGKMEYGPRALGNRSILCQATDPAINHKLNRALGRTEFMPFAPATLAEHASTLYKGITGAEYAAEFMTLTFQCFDKMRQQAPAVVHVDDTARPQLVTAESNPEFHELITYYYQQTGLPSLINTSFNCHDEPIVCSPDDAIRTFQKAHLDYLAIEDCLVSND